MQRIPTLSSLALAATLLALPAAAGPASLDEVLDRIVEREASIAETLQGYKPLVETYLQTVTHDGDSGNVPVRDRYFLGRLELAGAGPNDDSSRRKSRKRKDRLLNLVDAFYSKSFKPDGFLQVMLLDQGNFDREHYDFTFLRREFLGELRTLVFEVKPHKTGPMNYGRFVGRIWVEDEGYHIVRYNGIYGALLGKSLHFDSWRLNMAPGVWLPAYVYTEEEERGARRVDLRHKGQTRIWGYQVGEVAATDEFTKVLVDAPLTRDREDQPGQISPVESMRSWEREAEENVLRRLESAGLLAPDGEVNQVLETVVVNLEVTNELSIDPPVRCRVLMTTPLESFAVGHTIVLSRGLVDVLPDEASLAMVLAHELSHILAGHRLDTKYAFSDQVLVGDREAMENFQFKRHPLEEQEADAQAVKLLKNSPYADKLGNAGLFLKALRLNAESLPALLEPHFGDRMAQKQGIARMSPILEQAPELDPKSLEQIAALPLGGRVMVDPWDARIKLMKNNQVALMSAREKMPFLVTPLMPYLARHGSTAPSVARETGAEADAPTAEGTDHERR